VRGPPRQLELFDDLTERSQVGPESDEEFNQDPGGFDVI